MNCGFILYMRPSDLILEEERQDAARNRKYVMIAGISHHSAASRASVTARCRAPRTRRGSGCRRLPATPAPGSAAGEALAVLLHN
jgi:hypothetical protein